MNKSRTSGHSRPNKKDGFSTIFTEAVTKLTDNYRVDPRTAEGLKEVITDTSIFNEYTANLTKGLSATSQEEFETLFENSRLSLLQESSLSSLQPVAALALPIIRKAWPRIGIKEAFPTEVITVPKMTIPHLIPYIMDESGVKHELPAALKGSGAVASSQKALKSTFIPLAAVSVDLMPAGAPVSAGFRPDPVLSVVKVKMNVTDAAGANSESIEVTVFDGQMDTRKDSISFTVSGEHSTGHVTSDTVFGFVKREEGTLTLTSINTGAASAVMAHVTDVQIRGKVETTLNKNSTHIGYDIRSKDVDVGSGEHFDASLPIEWLSDNLAIYGIDGTLKVIDLLTEVLAQKVDLEGTSFLTDSLDSLLAQGIEFTKTFDVHPTGQYVGSPSEWLHEIHRVIDNMAHEMRNKFNYSNGTFAIVGNPIDVDILDGITWSVSSGDEVGGSEVSYQFGAHSKSNKYKILSTQNFEPGTLYMFYVPSAADHMTYKYFPYTFHVSKSSEGWANVNNPHVPAIMLTKRHKFYEFTAMIGKIIIKNNDGTLPS